MPTGTASRSWRTILATQGEPAAPEQPYLVGSVVYASDTTSGLDVEAPRDLGESVRVVRREVELDELAAAAAMGDRAALERFLELIRTPVVRYCRARMGNGIGVQTAEDVAQDVLLTVCGALSRFRPGGTASMSFVYGLARNKVVDAIRAGARDRSAPTPIVPDLVDDKPGPEASAISRTDVDELRRLLGLLPPAHHEVLVLRIAMGLSAQETAVALGVTPGSVRLTQHRALNKLRALVAERRA